MIREQSHVDSEHTMMEGDIENDYLYGDALAGDPAHPAIVGVIWLMFRAVCFYVVFATASTHHTIRHPKGILTISSTLKDIWIPTS